MNWKTIVAILVASPFVALLGGVGVLAYNVSQTWDSRNTDALISGLVASCGMGGIVMAGLLAAIVGIPFAMRLMDKWRESDTLWPRRSNASPWDTERFPTTPSGRFIGYHEPHPPLLEAKPETGSWRSNGVHTYDLWEEENDAQQPEA
jgi:hypothetical protein